MAITCAALQAGFGVGGNDAKILQEFGTVGTKQLWYIDGRMDTRAGRMGLVETTAASNAATQAAEALAFLNQT